MSLTLCLHASAQAPRIYLLRDGAPIADGAVAPAASADPIAGPTLEELTRARLTAAGARPSDIDRIVIDVGPGRLSAVRAAVSFANALAFALNRPLLPALSSLAAGLQAVRIHARPAIVVHKSAGGTAYVGRVEGDRLRALRHGPLAETLARVAVGLNAFALVGLAPDAGRAILPCVDIADGGDGEISVEIFADLARMADAHAFVVGPVHPITEQSDEVND